MKNKVCLFLFMSIAGVAFIPFVNCFWGEKNYDDKDFFTTAHLFNVDKVLSVVNLALYKMGVSTDPGKVVIGRNGWLYLGDNYANTITVSRVGATVQTVSDTAEIVKMTCGWDAWLKKNGVMVFKVLIGPNKDTIYSENLPHWALPAKKSAIDGLFLNNSTYVDVREELQFISKARKPAVYYKTDTHWNVYGAGVAFEKLMQETKKEWPALKTLDHNSYQVYSVSRRDGGDLSRFLKIDKIISDDEYHINVQNTSLETKIYDYSTNNLIWSGNGSPLVDAAEKGKLIISSNALNNKRVLWLSDSFGTAMQPFMSATFSKILKFHRSYVVGSSQFSQLVNEWKPDFVFITSVERDSSSVNFMARPPYSVQVVDSMPTTLHQTKAISTNDLKKVGVSYKVNGVDPYIVYELNKPAFIDEISGVNILLNCHEMKGEYVVPLQLFWMTDNMKVFDERRSIRLNIASSISKVDLSNQPDWKVKRKVNKIRLDIDAYNRCLSFDSDISLF
ncbi:alginate O-acetyltransferase AlgX-related protein [Aeromonas veronii]|uniref:alginate O-acetyltransferase AlgX-related protein n=1 Tax=Aeromonas veronii TaxID=654 RepID=UPI001115DFBA|nr:hypothetical protein [Aeromonas veronii]